MGLSSIDKAELSVAISAQLPQAEARRLLRPLAGYIVSANYRPEAGDILRHEDRCYRLVQSRRGLLLLRASAEETE